MTKSEIQQEALSRARNPLGSASNWPAIYRGFQAKGIAQEDIKPRINVLTYHAWKALGRQVRKGEHGVKIVTYIPIEQKADTVEPGKEPRVSTRPRMCTVFHESQTDPVTS